MAAGPVFDLTTGAWSFSKNARFSDQPSLIQSLPQKLVLSRTFVSPETATNHTSPAELLRSLKDSCPTDYFPPDLLHSIYISESLQNEKIKKRQDRWQRLKAIKFGDSELLAHPCGQDGGRRLCISRVLPWYPNQNERESPLDKRYQCVPRDFVEWDCGLSPIRHMAPSAHSPTLHVMNDERINVFDFDDAYEDVSWIGSIGSPYPSALVDFCELGDSKMVLLNELGRIWTMECPDYPISKTIDDVDQVIIEESGYRILCRHPNLDALNHFMAATDTKLSMFDLRSQSPHELLSSTSSILTVCPLDINSFVLSTETSVDVHDLRMVRPGTPTIRWDTGICFGNPITRLETFKWKEKTWLSASNQEASFTSVLTCSSNRWQSSLVPRRLASLEGPPIIGSSLLCNDNELGFFHLREDSSVSYTVATVSTDGKLIDGSWDMIKGKTQPSYSDMMEVESMFKRGAIAGTSHLTKVSHTYDYSYIWNWLWYGRADSLPDTIPNTSSDLFGLGPEVTKEIQSALCPKEREIRLSDETIASLPGPASILLSRRS